mgnify:CR=1 FL=1
MKARKAIVKRKTRETNISVDLKIDGKGKSSVKAGLPFLNHMLELLARHSWMDLKIIARGDLEVDFHHTVEDIGLVLGEALDKALGTRKGIQRYGCAQVPMDESLSSVSVDLGGRPYYVKKMACRKKKILDFDLGLFDEFFLAFVNKARINLHIAQMYGQEPHHAYESVFKALAVALRSAVTVNARVGGVPSSKGRI